MVRDLAPSLHYSGSSTGVDVTIDFQRLFESCPGLYLILSPDLVIRAATDAYLRATMTRREDIIGRDIFDVFPDNPDDPDATGERNLRASFDIVRRDLVSDTLAVQQYDVRRPESDGGGFEERHWSPVNIPVLDRFGRLAYIMHRVDDVTEMVEVRRHESELENLTAEQRTRSQRMLAELVQRGAELQRANQRLVELDVAKSEFLSRMSHELRTPLNSILGFGQLLEREALTEDQLDSVAHIAKAGRHLLRLINEVLDIARIESRQMELSLEPVDLADVLEDAVRLMEPVAAQHGVRIEVASRRPQFVRADRQRLQQMLLNLLSNAVKYNREYGVVQIKSQFIESTRVRLSVSDTGIGIPAAEFASVFEPFARLGAEQTPVEGTGIGLALTKRLTELMGGTIGFDSTLGEGSTFWIELDSTAPHPEIQGPNRSSAWTPAVHGWRGPILYVEDNLANLTLVKRILRSEPGVEVLSAMQGSIGLEMARELHPRMILLDVHLPDMLGQDMLVDLKRHEATASIPVVVLSADATERQIQRLIAAGASAYLTKPLDLAEFERVVGPLLSPDTDLAVERTGGG